MPCDYLLCVIFRCNKSCSVLTAAETPQQLCLICPMMLFVVVGTCPSLVSPPPLWLLPTRICPPEGKRHDSDLEGMPCTQRARNAHAVRSFGCRPIFGPSFWPLLTSFWFHTGFFFSFLCIWDVAHLNCHPLLPNVNHFYPFSIPHIELSLLWGP